MAMLNTLLKVIDDEKLKMDKDMIRLAFDFADEAHQGQLRKSGEPYVVHPLETAITLAKLHLDQETIIAGLLHDVPEETSVTLSDIEKNFGQNAAQLVEGITKLGKNKKHGQKSHL